MKCLNLFLLLALLIFLGCTTIKSVSQHGYFIHGSKKHAEKFMGEFANNYHRTNGSFGLRYEGTGERQKGGSYMRDYLISHDDHKGEIFINEESFIKTKKGILPELKSFVFCADECEYVNTLCYCDNNQTKQFYGKDVTIKYFYDGKKRLEKSLYVPTLIQASFPNTELSKYLRPMVPSDDFVMQWNKDEKNEFGVLITLHITFPQTPEEKKAKLQHRFSKKSITVPDNGYYKFEEELFNELPSETQVVLTLERGRLPIVQDIEGNDYKIRFTTEFSAQVIVL